MFTKFPCAHRSRWSEDDFRLLMKVESFSELADLAIGIISRFSVPASMVSGPISTGGRGTLERNLEAFGLTIVALQDDGYPVFSQMPLEARLIYLCQKWRAENPGAGYCMSVLTDFYGPVFRSGKVDRMFFRPDWQSSFGARWERETVSGLGFFIVDLDPSFDERLNLKL